MSILIVDDDANTAKVLTTVLNQAEYDTVTANSVDAAIKRLQRESEIALVILDIQMPGGRGFEFLDFLRSNLRFRHIPVIMCSGCSDQENLQLSIQHGAKDFLAKPVKAEVLLQKVKRVLEQARKTVLVVHSDTQLRAILRRMVEREGLSVACAQSGKDAIETLDQSSVDMVITEVAMSGMSGWDLLVAIKEKNSQLPVLLISDPGKASDSDVLAAGADGIISFPFENITVGRTIKEVFSRGDKAAVTQTIGDHAAG